MMVTAAVRAGAMGNAGAAMRAAVRATLNQFARVALRGGAFEVASLCVKALVQAASAMYAAAHTSSRASRCQLRKSCAGRPAPAQKNRRSSLVLVEWLEVAILGRSCCTPSGTPANRDL